ncbi:MAG: PHB depolymerase family esterase [Acidobacteria bacterium]|nr:PHB depolymerase family esterase [Acidobacteriota bacterium]
MRAHKLRNIITASLVLAGLFTSAFALTPGSGTWVQESNSFGLKATFTYVPKNTAPEINPRGNGGRALMVSLHGCTQKATPNVINKGFNWESTAEKYGMVVVAPTSNFSCWDWLGDDHVRNTRESGKILDLVAALKARPNLNIDPKQVYITGLSAGAAQAFVVGCLTPDIFTGVGPNASPNLGTPFFPLNSAPTRSAAQIAASCKKMAATDAQSNGFLNTQIISFIDGTADTIVPPAHQPLNRDGMKSVYGAISCSSFTPDSAGTGEICKDGNGKTRISTIVLTGMPHAWPGGAGGSGGGQFVDYTRMNYPAYVTKYFFDNNMRLQPPDPVPTVTSCASSATTATSATITGSATDNGSIASYKVVLTGPTAINDTAAGSGRSLSKTYTLNAGFYTGTVTATDNLGQASAVCNIAQFKIGNLPAIQPPTGLATGTTTSSTVPLTWNSVSGATGYNVYRNGSKVTATPLTVTNYADTGLPSSTIFNYAVSTVTSSGESALSATVPATTQAPAVCTTASNFAHVQAGRAHSVLGTGHAAANGSNQDMGLNNVFFTTTLKQTGPKFYVIGTCP